MSIEIINLIKDFNEVVQKGIVYEVGHPHHAGIPHHPSHPPFLYAMARMHNDLYYDNGITSANDIFTTGSHTGTHMDAIGHIVCNGYLNEGIGVESHQKKNHGLDTKSIDQAIPVIKKAVLLDIAGYKGVDRLNAGYAITPDDIKGTLQKQGTQIRKDDAVLIRTGWSQLCDKPKDFVSVLDGAPGINPESAKFLVELGMGLTGGDTIAFEVTPTAEHPVHKILLVDNGIHIIEVLNLEELAFDRKYTFMLVCLPLRIKGGTGSPVRPIAIC